MATLRKQPRGGSLGDYSYTEEAFRALLKDGRVSRVGWWMERNVWRGYSPTATWITDTMDRLPEGHWLEPLAGAVVKYLGTNNYFS